MFYAEWTICIIIAGEMEFGPSSITALADLIAPKEDSESDDDMVIDVIS